jgi:uncharacterized cupredoxin-like copper-binding protein
MIRTLGNTKVMRVVVVLSVAAACAGPGPPIEAPAGAAARLAAVDWGTAERLDVVLTEYDFGPAELRLREGQAYQLRLRNAGGSTHTFTAPGFFAAAALRDGPASSEALASGGTIEVAAGGAKQLGLVPLRAGRYSLECTQPLHAIFGMTGEIVVE